MGIGGDISLVRETFGKMLVELMPTWLLPVLVKRTHEYCIVFIYLFFHNMGITFSVSPTKTFHASVYLTEIGSAFNSLNCASKYSKELGH